jgi:acid phosphatase
MPYGGFQGFSWVNQKTGGNDYVRKHNPEVLYNSIAISPDYLTKIKNTTLFYEDLKADKLP